MPVSGICEITMSVLHISGDLKMRLPYMKVREGSKGRKKGKYYGRDAVVKIPMLAIANPKEDVFASLNN